MSEEASYLYAPLAHKLGLYQLKSELEDLSLKYLEHDAYYHIKEKLNATKKVRDAYISSFITPVSEQLKAAGLKFHIKRSNKVYSFHLAEDEEAEVCLLKESMISLLSASFLTHPRIKRRCNVGRHTPL